MSLSVGREDGTQVEQGEEQSDFQPTLDFTVTSAAAGSGPAGALGVGRACRAVASHATKTTKIRAAKEDDARSHARAHSTELRRCRPCGG